MEHYYPNYFSHISPTILPLDQQSPRHFSYFSSTNSNSTVSSEPIFSIQSRGSITAAGSQIVHIRHRPVSTTCSSTFPNQNDTRRFSQPLQVQQSLDYPTPTTRSAISVTQKSPSTWSFATHRYNQRLRIRRFSQSSDTTATEDCDDKRRFSYNNYSTTTPNNIKGLFPEIQSDDIHFYTSTSPTSSMSIQPMPTSVTWSTKGTNPNINILLPRVLSQEVSLESDCIPLFPTSSSKQSKKLLSIYDTQRNSLHHSSKSILPNRNVNKHTDSFSEASFPEQQLSTTNDKIDKKLLVGWKTKPTKSPKRFIQRPPNFFQRLTSVKLKFQSRRRANVVNAFEKSLSGMTCRLHSLTSTAEEKDSELVELKNTIDCLKKQSSAVFAEMSTDTIQSFQQTESCSNIQSSESLVSLVSDCSLSSQDTPSKRGLEKNKKTGWLRQSFGKAFKKKSVKGSTTDLTPTGMGEMRESASTGALSSNSKVATPSHTCSSNNVLPSKSSTMVVDETGSPVDVCALKQELEEKNIRLTDVQLDALSSAHQLDQMKDMMTKMSLEMSTLRAENERLQRIAASAKANADFDNKSEVLNINLDNERSNKHNLIQQQSVYAYEFELVNGFPLLEDSHRVTVCAYLNTFPTSASSPSGVTGGIIGGLSLHHQGNRSSIELSQVGSHQQHSVDIGCIVLSPTSTWCDVQNQVRRIFKEYVSRIDPTANLGLNAESLYSYQLAGNVHLFSPSSNKEIDAQSKDEDTQLPLSIYLSTLTVNTETKIAVILKGSSSKDPKSDKIFAPNPESLAFTTLIPKTVLQRYVSLLCEHRRIMLCGPSGTGKSYLANRLAEYLVMKNGKQHHQGAIATFKIDHKSSKELRTYLSALAEQLESNHSPDDIPTVIILDNLHHVVSLAEVFNSFLSVKHNYSPFVIGTMNQTTTSTTNLQLHHNFRWVLCANHIEPVKGFLGRYLQRKLIQSEVEAHFSDLSMRRIVAWIPTVWRQLNRFLETHSSSDVTIGPRLFLSCPMTLEASKVWFTDLWNYSLVPYLLEAVREGLQQFGRRAAWEDPMEWIQSTWPWTNAPGNDVNNLMRLRPEDVGYDPHIPLANSANESHHGTNTTTTSKLSMDSVLASNIATSSSEHSSDPLMTMLLKLQEVSYSGVQTDSSDSNSLGRDSNAA